METRTPGKRPPSRRGRPAPRAIKRRPEAKIRNGTPAISDLDFLLALSGLEVWELRRRRRRS